MKHGTTHSNAWQRNCLRLTVALMCCHACSACSDTVTWSRSVLFCQPLWSFAQEVSKTSTHPKSTVEKQTKHKPNTKIANTNHSKSEQDTQKSYAVWIYFFPIPSNSLSIHSISMKCTFFISIHFAQTSPANLQDICLHILHLRNAQPLISYR